MSKLPCRGIAVVAGVAVSAAAANAETVHMTYTDSTGLSAIGTFTVSYVGWGAYLASSGTVEILACPDAPSMVGTFDLIANPNAPARATSPLSSLDYTDLVYYPQLASGYLDTYGMLFGRTGEEINLWGNSGPGTYSLRYTTAGGTAYGNDQGSLHFQLVPLPPAALAGMGGLVLLGGVHLRRRAR